MPDDVTLDRLASPSSADQACSCDTEATAGRGVAVDPVVACTLGPSEVPTRVDAWAALAARAIGRELIDGGLVLRFAPAPGLAAEVADLASAEQSCCAFFRFAVVLEAGAITLEVSAPPGAEAIVDALFPSTAGDGV